MENSWIILVLILSFTCYFIFKLYKFRENEEGIYRNVMKKRNSQECPYDIEARSCQHYNGATGYIDVSCSDCDWYGDGLRPSKF